MSRRPAAKRAVVPIQLCLDLPVPEAMHAAGLQDGSRRPQVFNRTPDGLGVTKRLPAAEAWAVGRCVQHHSDTSWTGIYLDIDVSTAGERLDEAAEDGRIARPNILIVRRSSGHAAAGWFLQEPVHKYPGARDAPQRLFRRTAEYYRHVAGGDPGYNGATFRNALVAEFDPDEWIVERPAKGAYPLAGGLSGFIPKGWRIPRAMTTLEGRHVTLFRLLMKRAGPEYVADDDIRLLAYGWNEAQPRPLPDREVYHIVRHVLKYRDQWRLRPEGWHRPDFLARQAERRQASWASRRAAREPKVAHAEMLAEEGFSTRQMERRLGVDHATAARWIEGELRRRERSEALQGRRERAWELREAGRSIRDIARELGTSKSTAARDCQAAVKSRL